MNHCLRRTILMGIALLGLGASAKAQWFGEPTSTFAEEYLAGRLEIGLRIAHFSFTDPERETVGDDGVPTGGYTRGISTFSMHEVQNFRPSPYVRYYFNRYLGVQVAWEYLEGRTRTRDVLTREPYDHSNGNPRLRGPSFLAMGRYPLEALGYPLDHVTPYAGVGFVLFSGSFLHDSDWHANGRRNMVVDDTVGFLLTAGTSISIVEHLSWDLELNYVRARPDAKFWLRGDRGYRAEWTFPMDSWMFQTGLKYVF